MSSDLVAWFTMCVLLKRKEKLKTVQWTAAVSGPGMSGPGVSGPASTIHAWGKTTNLPPLLDTARGAGPRFQQAGAVLAGEGNGAISSPLMAERKKGIKFMTFSISSCFLTLSRQLNIIKPIYPSMHTYLLSIKILSFRNWLSDTYSDLFCNDKATFIWAAAPGFLKGLLDEPNPIVEKAVIFIVAAVMHSWLARGGPQCSSSPKSLELILIEYPDSMWVIFSHAAMTRKITHRVSVGIEPSPHLSPRAKHGYTLTTRPLLRHALYWLVCCTNSTLLFICNERYFLFILNS